MILFKTTGAIQNQLAKFREQKLSIGFVPTMGALHNGHLSLIKACKKKYDIAVCSIFINPTQFNDKNDFEKYPVTIESDIFLLETHKTDVLFLPSVTEVYNKGVEEVYGFNLGYLENILEGKYRPGHFQGVCNVVYRLLNIIQPDAIFLGSKDYQQYLVLKKMMQEFFPLTNISAVKTAREKSGLAMSSRNMRLSDEGHKKASAIYQSLQFIKQHFFDIYLDELIKITTQEILAHGFDKVDYVDICNAETLLPVTDSTGKEKSIALAAAYIEGVRLIDNLIL